MFFIRFFPFFHVRYIFLHRIVPSLEMIVGVIADGMSGLYYLFEYIRMFVNILSYHKESCLDIIMCQDSQDLRCYLWYRSIIKSKVHIFTRAENTVRVKMLYYVLENYQANEEAPRIAASESLRIETETGIFPFQIGIKFSSKASRIGSIIQ